MLNFGGVFICIFSYGFFDRPIFFEGFLNLRRYTPAMDVFFFFFSGLWRAGQTIETDFVYSSLVVTPPKKTFTSEAFYLR